MNPLARAYAEVIFNTAGFYALMCAAPFACLTAALGGRKALPTTLTSALEVRSVRGQRRGLDGRFAKATRS